ncbi:hypothetical protein HUO13_11735 [Saccharopolyspora erythraea]|uniref:hypothetical protein n=1 Tax=Saccharopolyspora erythraea TaxID=1836 RepID=UPI001BA82A70|nr:hypothetical protein [Saccharopolyspora erythraea]QUH01388.1 hypothetical protein HUO13_11735 [Saccharopolyspora erythraea]
MSEAERVPGPETIAAFWRWWERTRDPIAEAIGDLRIQDFVEPLRDRLGTLHPDLRFSLRPGLESAHAFGITGTTPQARRIATTVLAAAPARDAVWEYTGLGDQAPVPAAGCGDLEIELTGLRVAVEHHPDLDTAVLHFFHPMLAALSEEAAEQLLAGTLTAVMGDDGATRRTKLILTRAPVKPAGAVELSALRPLLEALD